ncbi:hypothetical protein [Agromyces aureus]|uniref:hypothetical protein n=1 Tax=Agromyces aureus TaxID=453304 RepID=UPI001260362E|nr:hypothetical protein [Agromyces aureus]
MSASSTPDPAARPMRASVPLAADEAARRRRREQKREQARRYRREHPEQHAATRRRWVEANRDRIRASNQRWREEHLEHARELNRESMRRAAARRRREEATRARARERVRTWRVEHPDRVRAYQREWVDANRDKVREYYNRYYAANRDEVNARATARRDADPEGTRARQQAWAEEHKEHRAELQRARRADPDRYRAELEANAAARRLKRALARAGLPPKRIHPSTAAARRADERASEAFFSDTRLPERLRQIAAFRTALANHMQKHHARMREFAEAYVASRERMGLPLVSAEDVMWARAVDLVLDGNRHADRLTSRDVAAAVRNAQILLRQREHDQQFQQFVHAVVVHVVRHRARLSAEAAIENRARVERGKARIDEQLLLTCIGADEVKARRASGLLSDLDLHRAGRFAALRIAGTDRTSTVRQESISMRRRL